jgi:hypothetical protein
MIVGPTVPANSSNFNTEKLAGRYFTGSSISA